MTKEELKERTMLFALGVADLVDALPGTQKGKVVTYQIVKAATSVAANYRAACRGRSRAEYVSKLQIVLEESDESHFWLEFIRRANMLPEERTNPLEKEANELTAIFNSTLYRARNSEK